MGSLSRPRALKPERVESELDNLPEKKEVKNGEKTASSARVTNSSNFVQLFTLEQLNEMKPHVANLDGFNRPRTKDVETGGKGHFCFPQFWVVFFLR